MRLPARPLALLFLLCAVGWLASAAPAKDAVARKRTAPGVKAALGAGDAPGGSELTLTDVSGWVADLAEEKAGKPELVTRVTVTLGAKGEETLGQTAVEAPWRGLRFPKDHRVQSPVICDLNEIRVKLLLFDASDRPTLTYDATTKVVLKAGSEVFQSFEAFANTFRKFDAKAPVVLDFRSGVPARHALTVLAIVCNNGNPLTIAAPEMGAALPRLAGLRAELGKAIRGAEKDDGIPRVGLRIRPDARCSWHTIQGAFTYAIQHRIARVTLSANAGELEIDLFPKGASEKVVTKREVRPVEYDEKLKRDLHRTPKIDEGGVVEKPIIILEEEVEIPGDAKKRADLKTKKLDSTSASEAFGVGGGAAGAYGMRWGKKLLAPHGGGPKTEAAVVGALEWLKKHQSEDGRWKARGQCKTCDERTPWGGSASDEVYEVGITSLAVLAFLGNGHTHRFGKHKRTVRSAIQWLKRQQKADGSIGFDPNHGESIYNQALATQALSEAYAVSRDFTLKRYAEKGVEWILKAQNPNLGWKYGVRSGRNDTSVTGAMLLALHAARTAKIDVPGDAFEGASRWFKRATASSGETGYETPGGGSSFLRVTDGKFDPLPVNTAISLFARRFEGDAPDQLAKEAKHLRANLPTWDEKSRKINFYYWYYGTNAAFQMGGETWDAWNPAVQKALLPNQVSAVDGGCAGGSWDPRGEWCVVGGRAYSTAMGALCLETYYRYERAK